MVDPVGMSPVAVVPMKAVIAWTDSAGLNVRFGVLPTAIRTTIVSPIARETPRMIDATIPESAAGKTTRVATLALVAPSAYAPSRSPLGTADIASSEIEA